jgi:hypothetical protein
MSSILDQRKRETPKVVRGKSQNGSTISWMVPEGSETLPVIYKRCQKEIRSNQNIDGRPGIFWNVKPRRWTTMGLGMHGAHPLSAAPLGVGVLVKDSTPRAVW